VRRQTNPPTLFVVAAEPLIPKLVTGKEERNNTSQNLDYINSLFDKADDSSTTLDEGNNYSLIINKLPITLAEPETIAAKNDATLRLTQLHLMSLGLPLIDKIRIDFGSPGFEPNGRDRYTVLSHVYVIGEDGEDYGLTSNGAEWSASSSIPSKGPTTLGTPATVDNWMHFDNTGEKWLEWHIQDAKRIKSLKFYSGGNNSCNGDFMKRVKITLSRGEHSVKKFVHTFPPVLNMTNFTFLDVLQL
jgi:hypothetical protein